MAALVQIVLGGILLFAGRRLFWLLAAGAGFVLGLFVTQRVLGDLSEAAQVIVPLAVAALFAVLALVGLRFVIGLVGFVAGGIALGRLLAALNLVPTEPNTLLSLLVFVVGGIAGALLLARLFELGLAILSSLLGAEILLAGIHGWVDLPDPLGAIALLALLVIGVVVQLGPLGR